MSLTASRPPGFSTRAISRKHGGLVGGQVDHAVADHAVHRGVGQRQLVDGRQVELDVRRAPDRRPLRRSGGPGRSSRASCRCRWPCRSARPCGRQEHVEPAAAAQVHHHLARPQVGGGRGVAAGQAHVGLGGDRGQFLGRVAERLGHRLHPAWSLDRPLAATEPYLDLTASSIVFDICSSSFVLAHLYAQTSSVLISPTLGTRPQTFTSPSIGQGRKRPNALEGEHLGDLLDLDHLPFNLPPLARPARRWPPGSCTSSSPSRGPGSSSSRRPPPRPLFRGKPPTAKAVPARRHRPARARVRCGEQVPRSPLE